MVQRLPDAYRFDPADPRAPSEAQWAGMSEEERVRVLEQQIEELRAENERLKRGG